MLVLAGDGLGRLQVEAPGEDRQAAERRPLRRGQQGVAPVQGAPQGLLAGGAGPAAPVSRRRQSSSRAAIWATESTPARAAASSRARGSPSSRAHTSATAAAFSGVRAKPGATAWARATNRRTAG